MEEIKKSIGVPFVVYEAEMDRQERRTRRLIIVLMTLITASEWEHLIDEWIFSERDRLILKRRLLDGVTFERLAEEFDLSTRHVKTIIYKRSRELFSRI